MKILQKTLSLFIISLICSSLLISAVSAEEPMPVFEEFEQPEYQFIIDDTVDYGDLQFEPIFNDDPSDPYIDDHNIHIELDGVLTQDGRAALNWTPYLTPDFEMYKVVHDQFDPEPYYPKHGYLDYFEEPHKTGYLTGQVPEGDNYFRICVITDDDRRGCSNTVYLFVEPEEFIGQEDIDPDFDPNEDEYEDFDPNLDYDFDPDPRPEFEQKPKPSEFENDRPRPEDDREVNKDPIHTPATNRRANILQALWKIVLNNLGTVVAIITVLIAVSGFTFASKNKRKSISKYINQIDDTYSEYKMKAKRCEAELYRLKDIIDDQLKTAKIDDGAYQLLMNRIEGYMIDIQKQIVNERFGGLPATMKDQMFQMMEDGEITETEFETMQTLIKRSELSATEQDSLLSTIKDFKKQDEMMKKGRKN